jgi:hypothetical protein
VVSDAHSGIKATVLKVLRKAGCCHSVWEHFMIDERVKIKCTKCSQVFRERAQKIRNGFQTNCQHCNRLAKRHRAGLRSLVRCTPVCTENLNTGVMVMKSAQDCA